ncbi:hypothetical protein V5799_033432, partial [Amblyomma americanum]
MEPDKKPKAKPKPKKNLEAYKRPPAPAHKGVPGVSDQALHSESEGATQESSLNWNFLLSDDTTTSNVPLLPPSSLKSHSKRQPKRKRRISKERAQKHREDTSGTTPTGKAGTPGATMYSSSASSHGTSVDKGSSETEHEAPQQDQAKLKLTQEKEGGVQIEALKTSGVEKTQTAPQRQNHNSADYCPDAPTAAKRETPAPVVEVPVLCPPESGAFTAEHRATASPADADTASFCAGRERWRNRRVVHGARAAADAAAEATSSSARSATIEEGEGFALARKPRKSGHSPQAEQESSESTSSGQSKMRSMGRSWISQIKHDLTGDSTPRKSEILTFLKRQMRRKTSAPVDEDTTFSCLGQAHEGLLPSNDLSWVFEDENEQQSAATTYSQLTSSLPSKSRKMPNASIDQASTAEKMADIEGEYNVPGAVWTLRSR